MCGGAFGSADNKVGNIMASRVARRVHTGSFVADELQRLEHGKAWCSRSPGGLRTYGWKVNFHLGAASRRPKAAGHAGISRAQIYHVRVLLQDRMESYSAQDVACMDA
jgi:hypothetical protein